MSSGQISWSPTDNCEIQRFPVVENCVVGATSGYETNGMARILAAINFILDCKGKSYKYGQVSRFTYWELLDLYLLIPLVH
jgi:hypothetical protein